MTSTASANRTISLQRQLSAALSELSARITPLDEQNQPGTSYQIQVKSFDEHGITFYHQSPLDGRRAMFVLESPRLGHFAAEVDLTWCHFNRLGQYTSGGRFVQLVGKTA